MEHTLHYSNGQGAWHRTCLTRYSDEYLCKDLCESFI